MKFNPRLYFLLSPIAALLLWEWASQAELIDIRFFPAPSSIFYHLFFVTPEEGIINDIGASLYRLLFGYVIGSVLGITIGVGIGLSVVLHRIFYPLIILTYPTPKIAILPLVMLIFGIGDLSKIVVIAIGSFFLVLLNTLHGVNSIDKIYHDVATVYKIKRSQFVLRVILPGALPAIFTGLKLAIGYSLVMVVAAEMSGADQGLGFLIWQSWETFSIKSMYAGIFVIGAFGLLFTTLLHVLERVYIPWKKNDF